MERQELGDLEVRDRIARRLGIDRLAASIEPVAADRRLDAAPARPWSAAHQREVLALELTAAHESLETPMRLGRAGDDQEAGSLRVEPVNDARPSGLASARDLVGQESVNQRARRVARCGVHDDARRLVDHEQVRVLVRDPQRHVLRLECGVFWCG